MSQKKPRVPFRQQVITEAFNPLIPTEVFIELNPELVQFYENEYIPENYSVFSGKYYKSSSCFPRRFCLPRPCTPV
ncbi:hypothetical protein [Anaeroselena agilis]|uniref:Uncharacterized protein n=1 Tax=Anaeroselena agilis TaxID=3063788 RepID=A0ABU3NY47_9FIRM|nr:hypothetical protein [Selenomonadales bacterium 4137-cl]